MLTVAVKNPEVAHSVRLADFENWLQRSGKTPGEQALNVELTRASFGKFNSSEVIGLQTAKEIKSKRDECEKDRFFHQL